MHKNPGYNPADINRFQSHTGNIQTYLKYVTSSNYSDYNFIIVFSIYFCIKSRRFLHFNGCVAIKQGSFIIQCKRFNFIFLSAENYCLLVVEIKRYVKVTFSVLHIL